MRTIPEIVAQMRELIEELEQHTGKPAPKEEGVKFTLYGHDYMAGDYSGTDTISLTNYDLKPLTPSDISSFKF
jgi:hypothetical protein